MDKVPQAVINYVKDGYSQLQGYVVTHNWTTPSFPIERGVFQGDTMSSMIVLLVMSPILHLAANWEYQGFCPLLPLPGTKSLPAKDSTVYVLWDEPNSSEPEGWYLVRVCDYLPDGKAVLRYPRGETG